MKLVSLALAASFVVAGYAYAQTPAQAPAASQPSESSSSGGKISHDCKQEVHKLCGRAHGDEMKGCVKDNLDMNKFSASCATELKSHAAPAKPESKPES
jgi:hypothetical protein